MAKYKLPPKMKPYIDSLGPDYVNIDPRKLLGGEYQGMLDVAFRHAKKRFFEHGLGFPHLGLENLEIRAWPGMKGVEKYPIAFCVGVITGGREAHVVYMHSLKGDEDGSTLLDWLRGIGQFESVH